MKNGSHTQLFPQLLLNSDLIYQDMKVGCLEFFISGQWNFARTTTAGHDTIFHELPWGLGLISPIVYNETSNQLLTQGTSPEWYERAFTNALRDKNKNNSPRLKVHKHFHADDIWFVNCIMPHYGDCLSLLMRTGCLKNKTRFPIALVPSELVRLVPDWYAEVWEIETAEIGIPSVALEWNDKFNNRIREEFKRFNSVYLPHLFQPAAPSTLDSRAFTGVEPFDLDLWKTKPAVVTFLWREQRLSPPELTLPAQSKIVFEKMHVARFIGQFLKIINLLRYRIFITAVCRLIRNELPDCRFNVIGLGTFPRFPPWINDQRVLRHTAEADKNDELIASKSHVMISAHGSHLVGLSCLPGCVIQLIPDHKWINWLDALSMRNRDTGGWINYLSIPSGIRPTTLAHVVISRIHCNIIYHFAYSSPYSGLLTSQDISRIRNRIRPISIDV